MNEIKKSFHETVAEKLIAQLREGTAPWQKPWDPGEPGAFIPTNATTGKRYKGINALQLMSEGHEDVRWMTYKQAESVGAQVRKGEKGTTIQYWKFAEEEPLRHADGTAIIDGDGESVKGTVALERPRVFFATVFNAEQIEGLPQPEPRQVQTWQAVERAEQILQASGAQIFNDVQDRAFYRAATDSIHLPDRSRFSTADNYYATALHELGHWTGHDSRLERDLVHPFGSEGYAREELRAEIASMILGDELGIGHDPGQHAAYVGSWIKALQEDPLEIFRAAADAEKIQEYVMNFEHELEQQQVATSELVGEIDRERAHLISSHDGVAIGQIEQQLLATREGQASTRVFITVPFKQKDEVKALGAKWDRHEQSWYVPPGVDAASFTKWTRELPPTDGEQAAAKKNGGRQYLAVPYADRDAAKAAGAKWDKVARSWFAGPKADMAKLEQWKPENVSAQQNPAMSPRDEFARVLVSAGCIVSGDHPVMDSKPHRITVEGEKFSKNAGSGFYVAHLDNHPGGYVKNNKTGVEMKWRAKGYVLDAQERALLATEAAAKAQQRGADLEKRHAQAANRVAKQLNLLKPIVQPTPYLLKKGIDVHAGAFTDDAGKTTYLPATDADGKQWSMQFINEDGRKRFAKDSRKEGCFHVVGGFEELKSAPALVISEGYATAAQLKQALGYGTVCAFDAGNLAMVAQALHQKFPGKPVIIAGDDDRHLELTHGINPGRKSAEEAANLVAGKLLVPVFAPGENGFPADLDTVTPASYREHQRSGNVISPAQRAALSRMRSFTDFNDLANSSELGRDGLDRQLRAAMEVAFAENGVKQSAQQTMHHKCDEATPIVHLQARSATARGMT
jgi:putative DNA primase/helicase